MTQAKHEYEALIHFIKFGSHLDGSSSKTDKRLTKLALNYKFVGTNILHLKVDKWLKVPQTTE